MFQITFHSVNHVLKGEQQKSQLPLHSEKKRSKPLEVMSSKISISH